MIHYYLLPSSKAFKLYFYVTVRNITRACVNACVCVCQRERERACVSQLRFTLNINIICQKLTWCVYVCVCACMYLCLISLPLSSPRLSLLSLSSLSHLALSLSGCVFVQSLGIFPYNVDCPCWLRRCYPLRQNQNKSNWPNWEGLSLHFILLLIFKYRN